jgi:hypothetical protein
MINSSLVTVASIAFSLCSVLAVHFFLDFFFVKYNCTYLFFSSMVSYGSLRIALLDQNKNNYKMINSEVLKQIYYYYPLVTSSGIYDA